MGSRPTLDVSRAFREPVSLRQRWPPILTVSCGPGPGHAGHQDVPQTQRQGCESLRMGFPLPSGSWVITGHCVCSRCRPASELPRELPWSGVASGRRRWPERPASSSEGAGPTDGGMLLPLAPRPGALLMGGRSSSSVDPATRPTAQEPARAAEPGSRRRERGGTGSGRPVGGVPGLLSRRRCLRPASQRLRASWAHLEMFGLIECRFTLQK